MVVPVSDREFDTVRMNLGWMSAPIADLPVVAHEPAIVRLAGGRRAYEPIDEPISRVRVDRRRRVIVLALNATVAASFAEDHGLLRRQVICGNPRSVRGWTGLDVVVLPGWQKRRDAEETWLSLLPVFACGRAAGR